MATFTPSGPRSSNIVQVPGLTKEVPSIQNVSLPLANTEYTVTLPANTVEFEMKTRHGSKLQFCYSVGQSNTTYVTLWPGEKYREERIAAASITVYVRSSKAAEILELVLWT